MLGRRRQPPASEELSFPATRDANVNALSLLVVTGTVFLDLNGNGIRDPGERGLPNIVVSNQDTVVTTDASGTFRMSSTGTGVVFVSLPDGYRAVGNFWRATDGSASLAFGL